ncbi:MAG: phenylalanine--tRNA ligase subunit beta, partial [Acidobacteria bacterium]|nr:phenylalanine--tRNA ligase subunit beta [Acidobacteriota bacterium]
AGADHWSGGAREVDFFDLKGVAEQLCGLLGVPARFAPAVEPYLVPGQTAVVLAPTGAAIGRVGLVAPQIADARGLPRQDRVLVAELDLDAMASMRATTDDRTRPLPRHPSIVRDLSVIVTDTLPAEIIRGTMQAVGAQLAAPLASIAFFDRYQGKGVPEGSVSLSVRLTFQAPDRTLTDADVQQSVDQILAALIREHGAVQR